MNLGVLLSLNDQLNFPNSRATPMPSAPIQRQGVLLEVKPVSREQFQPVLQPSTTPAGARAQSAPVGRAVGRLLVLLSAAAVMCLLVGFSISVQHVVDLRYNARLGQQLRHREAELRTAKAACRALEASLAQQVPVLRGGVGAEPVVAKTAKARSPTRS